MRSIARGREPRRVWIPFPHASEMLALPPSLKLRRTKCITSTRRSLGEAGRREVQVLFLAVDVDAPRAGFEPDAGDGVLALAGRISASLPVELWTAFLRGGLRLLGRLRLDQR